MEVTAGASKEDLGALLERLPALTKHVTAMLASEAQESKYLKGLVVVRSSGGKTHGKALYSPTVVENFELVVRIGAVNACLTLRSCEVVNAEAEYNVWYLTDLDQGKVLYPRGPIELTPDGELKGEGKKAPTTESVTAFRRRCGMPGDNETTKTTDAWFRSVVVALVAEARSKCSAKLKGSNLWEELQEWCDPACVPSIFEP